MLPKKAERSAQIAKLVLAKMDWLITMRRVKLSKSPKNHSCGFQEQFTLEQPRNLTMFERYLVFVTVFWDRMSIEGGVLFSMLGLNMILSLCYIFCKPLTNRIKYYL